MTYVKNSDLNRSRENPKFKNSDLHKERKCFREEITKAKIKVFTYSSLI
jgi:hypothetical protein